MTEDWFVYCGHGI